MIYKIKKSIFVLTGEIFEEVIKDENGVLWTIPKDPANTDYQAYLKWVSEGGVPLPADE